VWYLHTFSLLKHLYLTLSKYLPKSIIRSLLAHLHILLQATSYGFSRFLFNNLVIQFLAVKMEASHCSETLVPIHQTARCHISFSHLVDLVTSLKTSNLTGCVWRSGYILVFTLIQWQLSRSGVGKTHSSVHHRIVSIFRCLAYFWAVEQHCYYVAL
jgi:hypothetical protein